MLAIAPRMLETQTTVVATNCYATTDATKQPSLLGMPSIAPEVGRTRTIATATNGPATTDATKQTSLLGMLANPQQLCRVQGCHIHHCRCIQVACCCCHQASFSVASKSTRITGDPTCRSCTHKQLANSNKSDRPKQLRPTTMPLLMP